MAALVVAGAVASTGPAGVSTAGTVNEPYLAETGYYIDDVATGHANTSLIVGRSDEIIGALSEPGTEGTVSLNLSSLAARGVDFRNATVASADAGDSFAVSSTDVNATSHNLTIGITPVEGSTSRFFDVELRVTGIDTSDATTASGLRIGIGLDDGRDGTFERVIPPSSDAHPTVELFAPVRTTSAGPDAIRAGSAGVVQRVEVQGTPSDPYTLQSVTISDTGTVAPEAIEHVTVRDGDGDWAVRRTNASGIAEGLSVDVRGDSGNTTTDRLAFDVVVELTPRAEALAHNATINTTVTVAGEHLVAATAAGESTAVSVPLRDASFEHTNATAGSDATYRGSFVVANGSGTYRSLAVDAGAVNDWGDDGGSFDGVDLDSVTVAVNGSNVVDDAGTVTATGDRLEVPLDGSARETGDVVNVSIAGVRNPLYTESYAVVYTLNPGDSATRVQPPQRLRVTEPVQRDAGTEVRSAVGYTGADGNTTIELVLDRSLPRHAVDGSDVTVFNRSAERATGPVSELPVADVRVGAGGARVAVTLENTTLAADGAVTAWGENYTTPIATTVVREGGANATGYGAETVAYLATDPATEFDVVEGDAVTDRATGPYSRVAVAETAPSDGGTVRDVDWNHDGEISYENGDTRLQLAAPTVALREPDASREHPAPANVTAAWTASAPPFFEVRVELYETDPTFSDTPPAAVRTVENPSRTETTFEGLTAGRYFLRVTLRDQYGRKVAGMGPNADRAFSVERLTEQWRRTLSHRIDALTTDGTRLFFTQSGTTNLTAVDLEGDRRWRTSPESDAVDVDADAGTLAVAVANETVQALDPADGGVRWQQPVTGAGAVAVGNGTVFAANETRLVAFDADAGTRLWTAPVPEAPTGAVTATRSRVVVGSANVTSYSYDGSVDWSAGLDGAGIVRDLAVPGQSVYAVTLDSLQEFSNGSRVDEVRLGTRTQAVAAAGDLVVTQYQSETYQTVAGFAAGTNRRVWTYRGIHESIPRPVAVNGTLYVSGYERGTATLRALAEPNAVASVVSASTPAAPGEVVRLNGTRSYGDSVRFDWTFDDGETASGETVTRTFDATGAYSPTLTTESPTGWVDRSSGQVVVSIRQGVTLPRVVPAGEPVSMGVGTPGPGVESVTWRFPDGTVRRGDGVTHEFASSGRQTVEVTINGTDGWSERADVPVTVSRGSEEWAASAAVGTNLALHNGSIRYVESADGDVVVLDADGSVVRNETMESSVEGRRVEAVRAVAADANGTLVSFLAAEAFTPYHHLQRRDENGSVVWETSHELGGVPPDPRLPVETGDGRVYAGSDVGGIRAYVERADGTARVNWSLPVPARVTDLVLAGERLYAVAVEPGNEIRVLAVAPETGDRYWSVPVVNASATGGGETASLLDPSSIGREDVHPSRSGEATGLPDGDGVAVSVGNRTVAVASNGTLRWRRNHTARSYQLVRDGRLVTRSGRLFVEDLATRDGAVLASTVTYPLVPDAEPSGRVVALTPSGEAAATYAPETPLEEIDASDGAAVGTDGDSLRKLSLPEGATGELSVAGPDTVTAGVPADFEARVPSTVDPDDATVTWETPVGQRTGTTITLELAEPGSYTLAASVNATSGPLQAAKNVSVVEPPTATFAVDVVGTNAPVTAGEELTVQATVANTGDASGEQTVTLAANGTRRDSAPVALGPGESTSVSLAWNTTASPAAVGETTAVVQSADDSDRADVTVQPGAPNLSVTDVTLSATSIPADGNVTVTATVANTGTGTGTETVALRVNGSVVSRQSVTVAPGATNATTFTRPFDDPGTYELDVDGVTAGPLTVEEPSTTETDAGTPGFGLGLALLAVSAALAWRRRE